MGGFDPPSPGAGQSIRTCGGGRRHHPRFQRYRSLRLIHAFLVLVLFLLGIGTAVLLSRIGFECVGDGRLAGWFTAAGCGTAAAGSMAMTADDESVPSDSAFQAQPTIMERRGPDTRRLEALRRVDEARVIPGVVQSAPARDGVARVGLPFSEPLESRTEPTIDEAAVASLPSDLWDWGGMSASGAAPSARRAAPLRVTSVPVPRDPDEAQRLLDERYPRHLRDSGIGGRVVLVLDIDRRGRVQDPRVVSGSGNESLDEAALEVARALRFVPARQGGRNVDARILQPLVFTP